MPRRRMLLSAVLGALTLAQVGCSFAVNLDADCEEVAECGAYTCDADNIACRQ